MSIAALKIKLVDRFRQIGSDKIQDKATMTAVGSVAKVLGQVTVHGVTDTGDFGNAQEVLGVPAGKMQMNPVDRLVGQGMLQGFFKNFPLVIYP